MAGSLDSYVVLVLGLDIEGKVLGLGLGLHVLDSDTG